MTAELTSAERDALLDIARSAIAGRLGIDAPQARPDVPIEGTQLDEPGACFVTLQREGRLLGCIGSMEPRRSLAADVAANAVAAAFADPRLPPITAADCPAMAIEISVLGPLEPLGVRSARELSEVLVPGRDGVLVSSPDHRGTFLPSVWVSLPRRDQFLRQLWRKAGLRPFEWPPDLAAYRYRTEQFGGAFAAADAVSPPNPQPPPP